MRREHRKFIFTQISGVIIGLTSPFVLILLVKYLYPSVLTFKSPLYTLIFSLIWMLALVGSIILWGRLLVILGVLSKEEAKGYPHSKPWEKNKL